MLARFTFLIAMFLGLAVAPVKSVAACAVTNGEPACHSCCAAPETACCELSDAPLLPAAPAKTAPTSSDGKQLLPPALVLLGLTPQPAVEPPSLLRQHAARIPTPPLVEKTCIRLI